MDTGSLIQAGAATAAVVVGVGLVMAAFVHRPAVVGRSPIDPSPTLPSAVHQPDERVLGRTEPHASWQALSGAQHSIEDPAVSRRAAVLAGLQLALLAALMIGGIAVARVVTADQLVRLGR